MKKVLFTEPVHPAAIQLIQDRSDIELTVAPDINLETLRKYVVDVQAIGVRLAQLPAEILQQAKQLQIVARHGVGCDNIDVAHLSQRNIPVAISAGSNAVSVAEHTLMLMLAATRRLPEQDRAVRAGNYHDRMQYCGKDLHNSQALIIGFGRTGQQVAPRCKAFGMQVTAADIEPDYAAAKNMGIDLIENFRDALPEADFVSLHVPLDQSTHHLLSAKEFANMKRGSILINCARGGVVDEKALIDYLEKGIIKAAGIDVFEREPAVVEDPLFGRQDIIATPHTAGTSDTAVYLMATMMAQNILDRLDGKLDAGNVFNLANITL